MRVLGLLRSLGQPIARLSLPGWKGYLFGASMVFLAALARWLLPEGLGTRVPFPTFFLAVFLTAWIAGWKPALFATLLTLLCGIFVFPISRPPWDWRDVVGLSFVVSVSLVGAYAFSRLRASTDVLEQDRAWYERILDRVGEAMLVVDEGGILRYFNHEAARLWALMPEAIGRPVADSVTLWFEDGGDRFDPFAREDAEQEGSWPLPLALEVRSGGRPVPVVGAASRFRDPLYGLAAILSVQSVEALRDATRQVASTERRMRSLFDSDIVGLFSVDQAGAIGAFNHTMRELLGYPPWAPSPAVLEEIADPALIGQLRLQSPDAPESRGPIDCCLRGHGGEPVWVSLGAVPISHGEHLVFVTDVRARKRAERDHAQTRHLLQVLVDQVPALVSFVAPDGRIVLANRHYADFVGAPVEGRDWRTGLPASVARDLRPYLRDLAEGRACEFVLRVPGREGRRALQLHLAPYRPEDGDGAGIVVYAYDITERLAREQAIASSEARFRRLAEASAAVVWQACSTGRLTAQFGWTEYTGAPPVQSMHDWLAWVHPLDLEIAQSLVAALREPEGDTVEAELRMRNAAGSFRHVHIRAVVLEGGCDGGVEWIGTVRDIHSRRAAEQALAAKESELRLILNAVPARMAYLDAAGDLQWANRNFLEWAGVPDGIQGRRLEDLLPSGVLATLAEPLRQARQGLVTQTEWYEDHARNGPAWTTTTFSPHLGPDGEVVGLISLCMDSTERHEAEEALRRSDAEHRTLAENVPHMVWMADAGGQVQYCNARWLEYTGRPEGGHFSEPMHPSDREAALARFAQAAADGGELNLEIRFARASDGAYRWHLVRALALRDEAGTILRWYGTCTDIQDQKAAQETLREANTRTNHFLATLSHELRNPLAALMASTEVLEKSRHDDRRRSEAVQAILRQSWHLKKLTDDLLDVSRITLGRIPIASEVVDLGDICRHVCEDFGDKAREAEVDLDCQVIGEPLRVRGDATRLRQCVDNLVSNAIKASSPGMQVRIRARPSGRFAEVVVEDEGLGIEAHARESIFQPFSQADGWRSRGLGLGLSIVRRLVELHGGSVWVESAGRNLGASFGIRLPALAQDAELPAEAPAASSGDALTGRVLIVDDEADNATALQFLLSLAGHQVQVAEDGIAAVHAASMSAPDVVICDLGLPAPMDGFEVATRLRALLGDGVHLCAYSGYGARADIERSLAAGFDSHLTKPGAPRAIAEEVQRGLARVFASRAGKG